MFNYHWCTVQTWRWPYSCLHSCTRSVFRCISWEVYWSLMSSENGSKTSTTVGVFLAWRRKHTRPLKRCGLLKEYTMDRRSKQKRFCQWDCGYLQREAAIGWPILFSRTPKKECKFRHDWHSIGFLSTMGKLFWKFILKAVQRHIEGGDLLKLLLWILHVL